MEANNRMLYDDIIKKTDVQYTIPVYQRTYTWEKENCNKLYDDIIASIKNNRNHYLGSLVYSESKKGDIKSCPVIDGQQRLTTVMLLLKAIDDCIEEPESNTKKKIRKNLYNELCEERYKLKLKNIENDNADLENVLNGNIRSLEPTSKITINYNNFKNRIKKTVAEDNISYEDLLNGVGKLEIVEIVLDKEDEPQKIFESINSTGVNLTTADLIRNFLLMGIMDAGLQAEYYTKYWVTLERLIGKENVEKFFYDFLVMKDTRYIEENKVYENFKTYYRSVDNHEKVFEEIIKFAEYYKLLVCNNSDMYSKETNELCSVFVLLKHNTIYPFLLKVCDDYAEVQKLYSENMDKETTTLLKAKEEEFNKILFLFVNNAIRRLVAEIPSSSLRRFYAGIYDRVFSKNKSNMQHYYKALEAYLCTIKTYDRMPTDETFINSLCYKNIYKKSKLLRYFFNAIENDNKEPVDMTELTIEHILPETLSNKWKEALGENYQDIYDKYVHTLGNLSITGYNSEYSNALFSEKKAKLEEYQKEDKLKITKLNKELLDDKINKWGEKQILDRANRLAEIIVDKYPYPKDIDTTLEFEKYYEFYIDNPEDDGDEFVGNAAYKIYGFKYDGVRYRANYFKNIYVEIVKILYDIDPTILDELARTRFKFENGTKIVFSNERVNKWQTEINPQLFIETGYSRNMIFWWIRELFKRYQLDIKDFCILFTDVEN